MTMSALLTDEEITQALGGLPGWRRRGNTLVATIVAPDFMAGIGIVDAAAATAEEMNHHPDIDIRWRTSHWRVTTHDADGLTQLDVDLAHRISALAQQHGAHVGE